MPAEWEPHEATWLAWPCNNETWPAGLEPVQEAWRSMARHLSHHEKVYMLVNDASDFHAAHNIIPVVIPNNDAWMRDAGPIFVLKDDGTLYAHDFIFNTWGKKYGPWDLDDVIPQHIGKLILCPVITHDVVLEGGSIEVNGTGTLLTTKQCLLNPNRNPNLTQADIEAILKKSFGVTNILWLEEGIIGDDTDGHIDDIARFVDARTIVAVVEDDPLDENHLILQKNLDDLKKMVDQDGNPFRVVTLPMPGPVEGPFGRSPASYANFYIANNVVLVPIFSDPRDKEALAILQDLFQDRDVIGIECTNVVAGLGAIHCVTQQQPKGSGIE